jgi:hypothetical protein
MPKTMPSDGARVLSRSPSFGSVPTVGGGEERCWVDAGTVGAKYFEVTDKKRGGRIHTLTHYVPDTVPL